MATEHTAPMSGLRITGRMLAALFLPFIGALGLLLFATAADSLGSLTGAFYMRTEPTLFAFVPFALALLAALVVKWTISDKAALRVVAISTIAVVAFIATSAVIETIRTKPIVAAAESFRPLPGLVRETQGNGDKFSPATGLVPCLDFIGFGCPNITRTWDTPSGSDRELTRADLQKVLDDSGWKDVKIIDCALSDNYYPHCTATGMVGGYKADVSIVKVSFWELRLYLRLPSNAR